MAGPEPRPVEPAAFGLSPVLITRKPLAATAAARRRIPARSAAYSVLDLRSQLRFGSEPAQHRLQSSILLLLARSNDAHRDERRPPGSLDGRGPRSGRCGLAMVLVRGGAPSDRPSGRALHGSSLRPRQRTSRRRLLGIHPFVATLGMMGVARGIALAATGGQSVVGIGEALPAMYASSWVGLPFSVVVAACAHCCFTGCCHTRFGTYVFAIGGNRESRRWRPSAPTPTTWRFTRWAV